MKKKCFKCGKEKYLKEFYKHPQMADGHLNKCIECTKKDSNKHRADNLEKVKAYDRKRGILPHRVAAVRRYEKTDAGKRALNKGRAKWAKQHPLARAAHCILGNAIRAGKIRKQPCARCGATIRIHGHHEDYYKPLGVIWLCPKCHSLIHSKGLRHGNSNL